MENGVYSQRLRAGRRRTYFFDVRTTKSDDYYITITESKKRFDGDGYDRHKLFLYKEDFNKFITALENTVDHVKNELMPDYDFTEFDRELEDYNQENHKEQVETQSILKAENQQIEGTIEQEVDSFIDEDLSF